MPLTITLGYQDINSIDADIGPLLLLALPLALWVVIRNKGTERMQRITLTTISLFALFSAAFWTYGYITTRDLWQTRLLLPALALDEGVDTGEQRLLAIFRRDGAGDVQQAGEERHRKVGRNCAVLGVSWACCRRP